MPKIWGGQRQTKMNTMFCRFFRAPLFYFLGVLSSICRFVRTKKNESAEQSDFRTIRLSSVGQAKNFGPRLDRARKFV